MAARERSDDRIVGRAFWRSLGVLGLLAAVIGGGFMLPRLLEPAADTGDEMAVAKPVQAAATQALPSIPFTDVTRDAGIRFVHVNGARGQRLLPETMGGGVAVLDYDRDGDQDLLFINSTDWPDSPPSAAGPGGTSRLYRNRGDGRFEDVSDATGLGVRMYGMGVAVGDVDGDGYSDVFISGLGGSRLFRNVGGTHFEDVTARARVAGDAGAWSTSAAFLDYDRDGDLDLFVCNYVQWSPKIDLALDFRIAGLGRAYGPPTNFAGTDSYLYRNDGSGRFEEVGEASGIHVRNPATRVPVGKALAVRPVDLDRDGWLDLVVANDTVQNFVFRNLRNGRFEEIGARVGLAFDNAGNATGAMGIDAAEVGPEHRTAIAIGNFAGEMTSYYVSQFGAATAGAPLTFTDEATLAGIGAASRSALSFGLLFMDANLDGALDLFQVNGHIENEINRVQESQQYAQPAQLFWQCGRGCARQYFELPKDKLGDLPTPMVGRGAAYADIDGDGDLDLVLTQLGGPARLLRNDVQAGAQWVRVRAVGHAGATESIGAVVELRSSDGAVQRQTVMPARSYLSQVELPVTFGLASGARPTAILVTWPDGARAQVDAPAAGRRIDVAHPGGGPAASATKG